MLPWQQAPTQGAVTHMLFQLVHQFVPLPLEGQHLLLGFLFIGSRQFQQCYISVFLADGRQQSLLSEGEIKGRR